MDCTRQMEAYLWEVWHELMRLVGQKLQIFADALEAWINTLLQKPLPSDWRDQLAQFLAVWDAEGYEVLPEHVRGLENWIEAWAKMRGVLPNMAASPPSKFTDNAPTIEPKLTESVEVGISQPQIDPSGLPASSTTPLAITEGAANAVMHSTVSQLATAEQFFDAKLSEAQACLDEIWRELQSLGFKLDTAKLEDEVDVDSEVDRIEDLIWRYNDALESARDTWLREHLDGEAYTRLLEMHTPATHGLPLSTDDAQARRAQLRDELLNRELFLSVPEARYVLDEWRAEYNHRRPHSGLGWQTPAAYAATLVDRQAGVFPTASRVESPVGAAPLPPTQHAN